LSNIASLSIGGVNSYPTAEIGFAAMAFSTIRRLGRLSWTLYWTKGTSTYTLV